MYSLRNAVRTKATGTYADSYPYRITTILYNKTKILSIVTNKNPNKTFKSAFSTHPYKMYRVFFFGHYILCLCPLVRTAFLCNLNKSCLKVLYKAPKTAPKIRKVHLLRADAAPQVLTNTPVWRAFRSARPRFRRQRAVRVFG